MRRGDLYFRALAGYARRLRRARSHTPVLAGRRSLLRRPWRRYGTPLMSIAIELPATPSCCASAILPFP